MANTARPRAREQTSVKAYHDAPTIRLCAALRRCGIQLWTRDKVDRHRLAVVIDGAAIVPTVILSGV